LITYIQNVEDSGVETGLDVTPANRPLKPIPKIQTPAAIAKDQPLSHGETDPITSLREAIKRALAGYEIYFNF
jgi:hypothetical protein